ncbi:MAG: metallophosphoesterase family protein [bacterium]|nr:metallophosphoesterase family protein [bacterium]
MISKQLAVISDIHGNRWALEAVLDDIRRRQIQDVVNLGDTVYGPLDPQGTAEILLELDVPTVRGNQDRILLEPADPAEIVPTFAYVSESLGEAHLQWLGSLETTGVVEEMFLCHASPDCDAEYLLWQLDQGGASLRRASDVATSLGSIHNPVVLCGHDHVPRTMLLPNGALVVNPGSVGLPAYVDDEPFPHVMETGTPHARYAVVSEVSGGWRVEDVAVPYDWQTAAAVALKNGRPDWVEWLRTGQASV